MKVNELITALQAMPPEAEAWHLYDGATRGEVKHVWLSSSGRVVMAGDFEPVYYDGDRPLTAPMVHEDPDWETGSAP